MKIVISVDDIYLYQEIAKQLKLSDNDAINARSEKTLFDSIENSEGDAYVISDFFTYAQRAIDFIKKSNPYTPIVFLKTQEDFKNTPKTADIMLFGSPIVNYEQLSKIIEYNINVYKTNFEVLRKLTSKLRDKIEFASCLYDPARRILFHKGMEIKKLSPKEGGILEILAMNYGQVVKKDLILEKVWRKTDYFAGRSMDVYITYLRNTLRAYKIKLTIKNISGIGLILE